MAIVAVLLIQISLLIISIIGYLGKLKKYKYERIIPFMIILLSLVLTFIMFKWL
jgi:hypothetical protein